MSSHLPWGLTYPLWWEGLQMSGSVPDTGTGLLQTTENPVDSERRGACMNAAQSIL